MTKTVLLGDICDVRYGKGLPERNRVRGNYPVYGSNGVVYWHEKPLDLGPGIVIGRKGSIGTVEYSEKDFWPIDTTFFIRAPKGLVDLRFLYYSLKAADLPHYGGSDSAIPGLNRTVLEKVELHLPELDEQKRVTQILDSLDAKIELNRRMNETLEKIGQTLFRHYFSDNPDRKNWDLFSLSTFGQIVCGKTPPKAHDEFFGGNTPFIKIPDMHNQTFIVSTQDTLSDNGCDYQKNKNLPADSICVSCIATVGLVTITSTESQTNQQINTIIPSKKYLPFYLYESLKSMKEKLIDNASSGSATPNMNTSIFAKIKIVRPDLKTLQTFDDLARPLFQRILINQQSNITLANLRDSLLQRLISGKTKG